jgi:sugar phosphate isomerase/epimerase
MKHLLNSAYCVKFDGYQRLKEMSQTFPNYPCGVELAIITNDRGHTDRLKSQADFFKDMAVSLHGPFVGYNAASILDSQGHQAIIDAYREAFDIYDSFHALCMVMHTNNNDITMEDKAKLQGNSIATILEITAMAKERGAHLTVENVGLKEEGSLLFDQEDFIRLFESLPSEVTALIDIGHAIVNRWDLPYVIKKLNKRITSYHIHNNDGIMDSHRPLFEEGLRYSREEIDELLICMEEYSPESEWILEYEYGNHITTELIHKDMQYLLDKVSEINA